MKLDTLDHRAERKSASILIFEVVGHPSYEAKIVISGDASIVNAKFSIANGYIV